MALTDLMREYVSLTNQLKDEKRDIQRKQLIYQLNTIQSEINHTIKARSDAK